MSIHFLQGIDTVIVRVSNIEKAKDWYTQILGLAVMHHDEKLNLVVLDTFGPTSLTIWETSDKIETNPQTTTYPIFKTIDAKLTLESLRDKKVEVSELISDHVVTYFTFYDIDGNVLEVCQVHDR